MYDVYIKKIHIDKVRHLTNIDIPISDDSRKTLILTGKNGSGKTSLLEAMADYLNYLSSKGDFSNLLRNIENLKRQIENSTSENHTARLKGYMNDNLSQLKNAKAGLEIEFSVPYDGMLTHFAKGEYVLAYYEATRKFDATIPQHVEKISLKDNYSIKETPRKEFVKYILDLKMTEALAQTSGNDERAKAIHSWFDNFEDLLRQIFENDSVRLEFNEEDFSFSIHQDGREKFDFQELSDGFAAVLDIVVDLMVRMQKHLKGQLTFDTPGIVLIDEIETHLHLELQRNVMGFLNRVFPNIQFIVSTHSPFILNSTDNAVIFDLENHTLVKDGLKGLPYDGIVKSYFDVDLLSKSLRSKYERYKELSSKEIVSDDELEEMAELEMYLDEIPDYLALNLTTEYRKLKMEFRNREDN